MRLLDTNILIDVLREEPLALSWLEAKPRPANNTITWGLVGYRSEEAERIELWFDSFKHLALDLAIARRSVGLRQRYGLKGCSWRCFQCRCRPSMTPLS